MKRLIYLVNTRLPTERAYGVQITKMCEAFADLGQDVELVFPYRKNIIKKDVFSYYNLKRNFKATKLQSPDFYFPGVFDRPAFFIKSLISVIRIAKNILPSKPDLIFTRDELSAYVLSFLGKNICLEAHRLSGFKRLFYRRFKKIGMKIVVISEGLKKEFVKKGFEAQNILVVHDGVDTEEFDVKESTEELRRSFGFPVGKIIIGYVGQLRTMGMEKGIGSFLEAFNELKNKHKNLMAVIVGGSDGDITTYKELAQKIGLNDIEIFFTGRKEHKLIPAYLKSFDLLVMPFPYNQHYAFYMSPLKMFEYMASGRPIVATDLPVVKEVLNKNNSFLVKPDSSSALANGMGYVIENPDFAKKIVEQALEDVKNYTWTKRAAKILEFIR